MYFLGACLALCINSVKVLVGALNQEKAILRDCTTSPINRSQHYLDADAQTWDRAALELGWWLMVATSRHKDAKNLGSDHFILCM